MDVAAASASALSSGSGQGDQVLVSRQTLQEVLEQCQRALVMLKNTDLAPDSATEGEGGVEEDMDGSPPCSPSAADEICDLVKSKIESPDFLEKLGNIHMSVSDIPDESASWDMVSLTDLWEDKNIHAEDESDQGGYVLVKQEDIAEGIACFVATYLLSLKETKEVTPNQLQEVLSKIFSVKRKKSKLRKAWDGSQIIYNLASWGATAIGIYQNPALFRAASSAFWTSCQVISKLI